MPPYGKFPCHKVAQHWEFHFPFLNSAILSSCNFGHSCLYLLKCSSNLAINYFCWSVLVCTYRYAFRHILGFLAHWQNTKEPMQPYAVMNCLSSLSLSSVTSSPTHILSPRKFLLYMQWHYHTTLYP